MDRVSRFVAEDEVSDLLAKLLGRNLGLRDFGRVELEDNPGNLQDLQDRKGGSVRESAWRGRRETSEHLRDVGRRSVDDGQTVLSAKNSNLSRSERSDHGVLQAKKLKNVSISALFGREERNEQSRRSIDRRQTWAGSRCLGG